MLEVYEPFKRQIAKALEEINSRTWPDETKELARAIVNAVIPACEKIDTVIQINPSYIAWNKSDKKDAYEHDLTGFMVHIRDSCLDLAENLDGMKKEDLPKMIVDSEIELAKKFPREFVYSDIDKLRRKQVNRILELSAIGEQLGIEKQMIAYYKKNSPFFTLPENIALMESAEKKTNR